MMVCDERNPRAVVLRDEVLARLGPDFVPDVVVVFGGDGFMLQSVATHGLDHTYLGINAGRVGFLLNDPGDDFDALAQCIGTRDYEAREFSLVRAEVVRADGEEVVVRAINDIYLERTTGQTAWFELTIDGQVVVDQMVADGLIFATSLGSTAYSFSAGGSPSHPLLRALHITPICPHVPRLTPFVMPERSRAHVEVRQPGRRPVRAVVDGRAIEDVVSVSIRLAERSVRLAWFSGHDLTRQMLRKIVYP